MTAGLGPVLLQLVEARSRAFRAAVAAAPDLEAQVPTCPGWTLRDPAQHLGDSHRRWAATVAAGPADAPARETDWPCPPPAAPDGAPAAPDRAALLSWSAECTGLGPRGMTTVARAPGALPRGPSRRAHAGAARGGAAGGPVAPALAHSAG